MDTRQPNTYTSTAYILAVLAMTKYHNLKNAKVTSANVADITRTDAIAGRVIGNIQSITDPGVLLDQATGKVGELQKIPGPDGDNLQLKITRLLNELSDYAKQTETLLNDKEALLLESYKSEQSLTELNTQLSELEFSNTSDKSSKTLELQQKKLHITTALAKMQPQIDDLESRSGRLQATIKILDESIAKDIEARKSSSLMATSTKPELGG